MANLTRGITLQSDDEVTAAEMHQGIESATVSDIARSDMNQSHPTVFISTAAPTANPTPIAGHLWYDTSNKVLMEYDGTDWKAVSRAYIFTNRSGSALSAGDVVVLDTGNDESVTTTTTADDEDVLGVVLVGGDNLANVLIITEGYCPRVNVTGSTNRGEFLTTSTTGGDADSTTSASNGSFGMAITTSATNVRALIGGVVMSAQAGVFEPAVSDEVTFTKSTGTPSGTTAVSHGLGRIPSFIQFNGAIMTGSNKTAGFCSIIGGAGDTKQMFGGFGESAGGAQHFSDYCCGVMSNDSNYMRGQLTAVTSTNFTITWSEVGSIAKTFDANFSATLFA